MIEHAQARSDAAVAADLANDHAPQILLDVDFITDHWPDLVESRMPGSSRPWRQALLDPERRARAAERDRDERANRDPDAPGFTSAPQHVDVLDVIVDTWIAVDELVATISPDWRRTRTAGALDRAASEHGPTRVTDIDDLVAFVRDWLPRAEFTPTQTSRIGRVSRRLTALTGEITRVLGLVRAGQILTGAVCPWCRGVTPKHPAGGATTMRVEEIPGSTNLGTPPAPAVVCWNSLCDPPDDAAGFRYRGRPAWPYHDWDWLAARLIIAEPARTPPPPEPARPAGFSDAPVLPIERFATSGISRTAPAGTHHVDALDGLIDPDLPPLAGQPVRFIGGPFGGKQRRFTRIQDTLAVAQPADGRPQLTSTDTTDDEVVGLYRFAIVNEHPSYVWAGKQGRMSA